MKKRDIRKLLRHEFHSPSLHQRLAFDLAQAQPILIDKEIERLERKRRNMRVWGILALGYFLFLLTLQILILLDGEHTLVPLLLTLPLVVALAAWMRHVDRQLLIFRILKSLPDAEEAAQSPARTAAAHPALEPPPLPVNPNDETLILPELEPSFLPHRTRPIPGKAVKAIDQRGLAPQTSLPM